MTPERKTEEREIKEGKIFAVVSYWLFLCILPFILQKHNKFAVFHGKQGLVLFIFLVAGFIFSNIPFIGQIFYRVVVFVYSLALFWGTIQALLGNYSRIPLVADVADQISI